MPTYNWVANYIFINQEDKKIDMKEDTPIVLVIGGLDPTGGAGVLADSQTILMNSCHPITLVTCLTAQNTNSFNGMKATNANFFKKMTKTLLKDISSIRAIKIGALANEEIIKLVKEIIINYKNIPVVLDPIIETSSGGSLISKEGIKELKLSLLPYAELVTPNIEEAKFLTNKDSLSEITEQFHKLKSNYIFIKDNEEENQIRNYLYKNKQLIKEWQVAKIKGRFQGTGCSISSCIASNLAKEIKIEESIELAQDTVHQSLLNAIDLGKGQKIPKRII